MKSKREKEYENEEKHGEAKTIEENKTEESKETEITDYHVHMVMLIVSGVISIGLMAWANIWVALVAATYTIIRSTPWAIRTVLNK